MAFIDKVYLATIVVLMTLLYNVECLKCVRCSSITERACLRGNLAPKNCSKNHIYCIKYESFLNDGRFVIRGCAGPEDDKTGCTMRDVENQRVKVCVSTCSSDGCNTAPRIYQTVTNLLLALLGTIIIAIEDSWLSLGPS